MKFAYTLTAASIIAFSSMASAEQPLSMAEMDGVSAGGFGIANAVASAIGNVTSSLTAAAGSSVSIASVPGQLGAIDIIQSDANAASASNSDGVAVAVANGVGQTVGSGLSDTTSLSQTATDSGVIVPSAVAAATNTSIATSVLIGNPAASASLSSAAASLSN